MGKLKSLISSIRRDNKIPTDEIIVCMTDALVDCGEDCCREVYTKMYKKAYGNNLTRDLADEWVMSFKVPDDSGREHGQKWTMEQTTDVGNKAGVDWNDISKTDWYVVMNMEYSKHYNTAKAYGNENDPMWFAHIAKDEWCHKDKPLFDYYVEYEL